MVDHPDAAMDNDFEFRAKVEKVDESLGLVFGWGIICSEDGAEYFDTQGDTITEPAMLKAASDFMQTPNRISGEMHVVEDGSVVFAFPLTTEIAAAFGITCKRTGMLTALKPSPPVLAKFVSGEYTGFSIGGVRELEEVVEE